MKKFFYSLLLLISFLIFSNNCFAMLHESDESYLKKVETYVNSLKKISGKFTQHSSNGASDFGKFYINKPGKMRLEYNSPILLVADGTSIVYEDKKSNQISYISMNSNPASIVLNGNITFTGKNPSVKVK
ncbi:MAG: outer membrane lipoprotein carrier protein LolA, partial [Alphaproteobacteria bacterium]|nr:outer membrane lipoprotein carrier protein LolA [Alphaproteobacteria bacterium]